MKALAIAVLLAGCGSRRPDVSAETPPDDRPARTIKLLVSGSDITAGLAGAVIAIRDGDGPWQELDTRGDLSFPVTARRYSVATACPEDTVLMKAVRIVHRTVDEAPVRVRSCAERRFATVHGTVSGAQGKVMVSSLFYPVDTGPGGRYKAEVTPGTRDLVAVDGEGDQGAWSTRRVAIVRELVVPDAATALDVDLATSGIDLDHREMTIEGLAENETGELSVLLQTRHGAVVWLTRDRTPPFVADLPPEGALLSGDKLTLSATADGSDTTRPATRDGDRWILGPDLGVVEATVVDARPPRVLLSWPRYPGAISYVASVIQRPSCPPSERCKLISWTAHISPEYLGDSEWVTFETPDFDLPALERFTLRAGDEIRWYVHASVGPSLGAGRDGTIGP